MLSDLADTIVQLSHFDRPRKVEIRVDRFATLVEAIERSGVILVSRKPSETIDGATFMGVTVLADPNMPPGFATVIKDGEIVNIIDLRSKEQEKRNA